MDWDDLEEGGEGGYDEDWVWEDDMPTPSYQAWWFDLTA